MVVFIALTGAPSVQSDEGESTVELAFIEVPVASADPILVGPETFAGVPGPAEWHSLPKDVSVVVFFIGEDPLGWQTPVSGTVALATTVTADQVEGNETHMVALNAAGADVASFTLFSAQTMAQIGDLEPPGSTTPGS